MKFRAGIAMLALCVATGAQAADAVQDTSFRDATGHRVLQQAVVVTATLADAWNAFATDDGLKRWAVPVVHIAIANDGMMESSYDRNAKLGVSDNIRNRIVAYLPEKLLVLQNVHVPRGAPFDPALTEKIRTVITFDAVDATHTRVTEAQVGYGDGAGFDSMYRQFRAGNALELRQLAQSFVTGPVDWAAEAARTNASVHRPAAKP